MDRSPTPVSDQFDNDSVLAEPPGGVLIWIIVFVEILTFAMGLIVFQIQARANPDIFTEAQKTLNQPVGLLITLLLLTGGWFMTIALHKLSEEDSRNASKWLMATISTGLLFLGFKVVEYTDKLNQGLGIHADAFFTLYWLLTGFHFVHVAVATVFLFYMWRGIRKGAYTALHHQDVESSGVFWHMCDLIWLLLYPILYLIH